VLAMINEPNKTGYSPESHLPLNRWGSALNDDRAELIRMKDRMLELKRFKENNARQE
jgi:hypothetical protein